MNAGRTLRLSIIAGGLAVGLAAEAVPAWAGTESVIHVFKRDHAARDGFYPTAPLIRLGSKLYGTTFRTVFDVTPNERFHVVHLFSSLEGAPNSLLNVGGLLYGTTISGGSGGFGTVFTLTLQGTENAIYTFQGGTDGSYPNALLKVGGLLYGTTLDGGDGVYGDGTAFQLTPQGTETVLHRFGTTAQGGSEPVGLIYANGVFYGTTYFDSTVFRLSKSGVEKVVTSSLSHGTESDPVDIGGVLYGIEYKTRYAEAFALTLQGVKTILHTFKGGSDGETPMGNLTNVGGTIYGTTYYGGHPGCGYGCGTVYSLTPQGKYTLIYAFNGTPDGSNPMAGVLDVDGTLYGTTYLGGDTHCHHNQGCGTIYAITP